VELPAGRVRTPGIRAGSRPKHADIFSYQNPVFIFFVSVRLKKIKVQLKIFNQVLIDPNQILNRDHDSDDFFPIRV
jgi:hypothetical protein